jgi:hypothetical protein
MLVEVTTDKMHISMDTQVGGRNATGVLVTSFHIYYGYVQTRLGTP